MTRRAIFGVWVCYCTQCSLGQFDCIYAFGLHLIEFILILKYLCFLFVRANKLADDAK